MTVASQTPAGVRDGEALAPAGPDVAGITRMLQDDIRHAAAHAPRSLQRSIGPSGVGVPCHRRLGYTLLDWPTTNDNGDPLPAIIGTATHAWLADVFGGRDDFLVEQRVTIRQGLAGSLDLFYKPIGLVLDWKIVGATAMRTYKANGCGEQYRVQRHLYGYGLANAGHDVRHVGCAFLPRGGRLSDLHVDIEPYDPAVAEAALERLDTVVALLAALDVETNPGGWALLPTTDAHCTYCPWFLPGSTDTSRGCPGADDRKARPTQFAGLLPAEAKARTA